MIGPAKLGPMNENWTDRVQDQHRPPIPELHSTRPPPEKPGAKQREHRRHKCSCQIERVRRKWPQQKRQPENEIIERRGRVRNCAVRKILKRMMPHDQSWRGLTYSDTCHPRIAIRIDKVNISGDKNVLIIRAPCC